MDNNTNSEQEYDEIMREAKEVYEFQESAENPYSFHKAFEYALNKLDVLNEKYVLGYDRGHKQGYDEGHADGQSSMINKDSNNG